ncbi:MAG TPA: hypothetical protein VNE63_20420 [Candidatus Acidoferrales bacterium]|nr:hypothetical protein [Candidatus Acidoferrales bacterium]
MPIAFAVLLFQLVSVSPWISKVPAPSSSPAPVAFAINVPDASTNVVAVSASSGVPEPGALAKSANNGHVSTSAATSLAGSSLGASLQDSQALSTIHIPDSESDKLSGVTLPETVPSRRNWIVLAIAQHAAAAFDAYSTREAIGHGAVEDDPLIRPFAHSTGIYAAIQVSPVVLDFVARRMQRSQNNFIRHTWWLPQSVSTALFLFSGVHNLGVASRP